VAEVADLQIQPDRLHRQPDAPDDPPLALDRLEVA
jgi:hypothetical protein